MKNSNAFTTTTTTTTATALTIIARMKPIKPTTYLDWSELVIVYYQLSIRACSTSKPSNRFIFLPIDFFVISIQLIIIFYFHLANLSLLGVVVEEVVEEEAKYQSNCQCLEAVEGVECYLKISNLSCFLRALKCRLSYCLCLILELVGEVVVLVFTSQEGEEGSYLWDCYAGYSHPLRLGTDAKLSINQFIISYHEISRLIVTKIWHHMRMLKLLLDMAP